MAVKTINISLDEKLIQEVDKAAKGEYTSRSHYIREALTRQLGADTFEDRFNELDKKLQKFMTQYDSDLKKLSQK